MLIVLLVILGLLGVGAGLYAAGLLDQPMEALGLKEREIHTDSTSREFTDHGLETYREWLTNKRFAPTGRCATDWIEFGSGGVLRGAAGETGQWELTRTKQLIMRDTARGTSATMAVEFVGVDLALTAPARGETRKLANCAFEPSSGMSSAAPSGVGQLSPGATSASVAAPSPASRVSGPPDPPYAAGVAKGGIRMSIDRGPFRRLLVGRWAENCNTSSGLLVLRSDGRFEAPGGTGRWTLKEWDITFTFSDGTIEKWQANMTPDRLSLSRMGASGSIGRLRCSATP